MPEGRPGQGAHFFLSIDGRPSLWDFLDGANQIFRGFSSHWGLGNKSPTGALQWGKKDEAVGSMKTRYHSGDRLARGSESDVCKWHYLRDVLAMERRRLSVSSKFCG